MYVGRLRLKRDTNEKLLLTVVFGRRKFAEERKETRKKAEKKNPASEKYSFTMGQIKNVKRNNIN